MKTVLVTDLEYKKGESVFSQLKNFNCIPVPPEEESLAEAIKSHKADHVIIGTNNYTDLLYKTLPKGGVIARFGVGHDGVDKGKATRYGLFCVNTPGTLNESVAELTINLIHTISRNTHLRIEECKSGGWNPGIGREMSGKTLSVIGCGAIGRRVAQIGSFGYGMEVIGNEIADLDIAKMRQQYGFNNIFKDFNQAVQNADFVSLHLPSNQETHHFINRERLAQMPSDAWFINTARGSIVDEQALFTTLSQGIIAGAALDVFENEPYNPQDPKMDLRNLDNVIMTPHIGSSTQEAVDLMASLCIDNIQFAEEGKFNKMNLLNSQVLDNI